MTANAPGDPPPAPPALRDDARLKPGSVILLLNGCAVYFGRIARIPWSREATEMLLHPADREQIEQLVKLNYAQGDM